MTGYWVRRNGLRTKVHYRVGKTQAALCGYVAPPDRIYQWTNSTVECKRCEAAARRREPFQNDAGKSGRPARAAVLLLCLCASVLGADDLTVEATEYLAKHSTPAEQTAWEKWWKVRSAELQKDHDLSSEEAAADHYMTAWLRTLADKLAMEPTAPAAATVAVHDKVLLCRWYLLYKARGWKIPDSVEPHLTREKAKKVLADKKP